MKGQFIESLSSYKTQCFIVDKIDITLFNRTEFITDGKIETHNSANDENLIVEINGGSYYCGDTANGTKIFLFTPECTEIPLNIM